MDKILGVLLAIFIVFLFFTLGSAIAISALRFLVSLSSSGVWVVSAIIGTLMALVFTLALAAGD